MSGGGTTELRYHYTSLRALLGILGKREVWFSDPRFLNDAQEWKHAGQILSYTIRRISIRHRDRWITAGIAADEFDLMVNSLCERAENYLATYSFESEYPVPFIFCLSKVRDSLSQWRAYGNGEYCIEFDPERLAVATGARVVNVEYRDVGYDESAESAIDDCFNFFLEFTTERECIIKDEIKYDGFRHFKDFIRDSNYYTRYKHSGFKEEEEVRLVRYLDGVEIGDLFFDDSGRYPIPRLKIKLPAHHGEVMKILPGIICGPGADAERARNAFNMFGLLSGIGVRLDMSKVPFRSK